MIGTALITGASSGIGKEFAKIHAQKGGNLVLVARREKNLLELQEQLTKEFKIKVEILSIDLSSEGAAGKVYAFTQEKNIFISYLFNNAGFGGHGKFMDRDLAIDHQMIHLNVIALVELTHLYLQDMRKHKEGWILNTASTAGFLPGPLQATYFATKAFVISFTKALRQELKGSGIHISALCPGPVKTEFEKVAGMDGSDMFAKGASANSTALKGYNGLMKGKLIIFDQVSYNFLIKCLLPFVPNSLISKIVEKIQTI